MVCFGYIIVNTLDTDDDDDDDDDDNDDDNNNNINNSIRFSFWPCLMYKARVDKGPKRIVYT